MATPVDFHYLADTEAQAAWRFYALRAGAGTAAQFSAALADAKVRVAAAPAMWPPDRYGARACRLKKYPFRLIYVEEPTRVLVLAVAHDRRRPGYWRRRVP